MFKLLLVTIFLTSFLSFSDTSLRLYCRGKLDVKTTFVGGGQRHVIKLKKAKPGYEGRDLEPGQCGIRLGFHSRTRFLSLSSSKWNNGAFMRVTACSFDSNCVATFQVWKSQLDKGVETITARSNYIYTNFYNQ